MLSYTSHDIGSALTAHDYTEQNADDEIPNGHANHDAGDRDILRAIHPVSCIPSTSPV